MTKEQFESINKLVCSSLDNAQKELNAKIEALDNRARVIFKDNPEALARYFEETEPNKSKQKRSTNP